MMGDQLTLGAFDEPDDTEQADLGAFWEPDDTDPDTDSDPGGLSDRELECLKKVNEQLARLEEHGAGDPIWAEELEELKPKTQLVMVANRVEDIHDDLEDVLVAWRPENRDGQRGYH